MTATGSRDRALTILRLATLLGLGISGYLLYLAMTGQTAPGCGEGVGGCGDVLSSRWSQVLGLPVSLFAFAAYALILVTSIHAGTNRPKQHRDGAWSIIGFVGLAAGLSALWFIALQFFVLRHVCYYCMAAHGCSLVIAGIALVRSRGLLPKLGGLPIAAMIAIQLLTPSPATPLPTIDHGSPMFGNFNPHAMPTLGNPDAPSVMALLYDYNCAFCREAHVQVADAVAHFDGQLAVVMLPTALDTACNQHVQNPNPHSATSCELARLALAVWVAEPAKFSTFDLALIKLIDARADDGALPIAIINSEIRPLAEQLVGKAALEQALADPRIDELMETSGEIYGLAKIQGRRGVPRLVIAGRALPGFVDAKQLITFLTQAYPGLAPATADQQ